MSIQSEISSSLVIKTEPAAEPVSTADAKTHMRVTTSADDTYIDALVKAARMALESNLNRQFISTTYYFYLDQWPAVILLPRPPVSSVTSISYVDSDGATQTWSSSNYQVDSPTNALARIMPAYGRTYPTIRDTVFKPITVEYVAGYGTAGSDVPEHIILAIKMLAAHWYEERSPVVIGTTPKALPFTVDALVEPYRVIEEDA